MRDYREGRGLLRGTRFVVLVGMVGAVVLGALAADDTTNPLAFMLFVVVASLFSAILGLAFVHVGLAIFDMAENLNLLAAAAKHQPSASHKAEPQVSGHGQNSTGVLRATKPFR